MGTPPPPPEPFSQNDTVVPNPKSEIFLNLEDPIIATRIKQNKKKRLDAVHSHSQAPSSSSSSTTSFSRSSSQLKRRIKVPVRTPRLLVGSGQQRKDSDADSLALPLGMSIAAVVAQVLERKDIASEKMSVDHLSMICTLAVKESLNNVFGSKFDGFVKNFEKSFRSTLLTLRLVNESSQISHTQHRVNSYSEVTSPLTHNKQENPELESVLQSTSMILRSSPYKVTEDTSMSRQLTLHHHETENQLACVSSSSRGLVSSTMLNTLQNSVSEQIRTNDLKSMEINLMMRNIELKERKLDLSNESNFLEKCKLTLGLSKKSFREDKFKTQLEDTRRAELIQNNIDCLVAGLFIMLACLSYGSYIYSHEKITEATASCIPSTGTKSWWMPQQVNYLSSGFHTLSCQITVLSRRLFGLFMIGAIAYLLMTRSASRNQTMPVTFILLLLGVVCGTVGKLCIDTLGGSGYYWLVYWEVLILLHFFANFWTSVLYDILYGRITASEDVNSRNRSGYLVRRLVFYGVMLLILPLLCGLVPFASLWEWRDHFSSIIKMHVFKIED